MKILPEPLRQYLHHMATRITPADQRILDQLQDGPKYGPEIAPWFFPPSYSRRRRLERLGKVEGYWGESASMRGGARRRYYRLVESGPK